MNMKNETRKWEKDFLKLYHHNLKTLIDAFTIYYGGYYYNYIKNVFKNLVLYFFINESALYGIEGNNDIVLKLKEYFQKLDQKINFLVKYHFPDLFIKRTYLQACYTKTINQAIIYELLLYVIEEDNMHAIMYTDTSKNVKYNKVKGLFLPAYAVDSKTLIHELNHALEIQVYAKGNKYHFYHIFANEEMFELLNEIKSLEIDKIFTDLKGNFPCPINVTHSYTSKLILVQEFYENFKDLIKEASIKGNRNLLLKKLGPKFLTFEKYIKKLYTQSTYSQKDFKYLHHLNLIMKDHLRKEQDYDYESYIQELQKEGHLVRKLQ